MDWQAVIMERQGNMNGYDETETNPEVANTIIAQLGASTLALLGAKDFVYCENSLSFKIGRNPKGVTRISIALDTGTDTYTVSAYRIRGAQFSLLHQDFLVYVDTLHDLIETRTGLCTRF